MIWLNSNIIFAALVTISKGFLWLFIESIRAFRFLPSGFSSVILVPKAADHKPSRHQSVGRMKISESRSSTAPHTTQEDERAEPKIGHRDNAPCQMLLHQDVSAFIHPRTHWPIFCANWDNGRGVHSIDLIVNKYYFNLNFPLLESGYKWHAFIFLGKPKNYAICLLNRMKNWRSAKRTTFT